MKLICSVYRSSTRDQLYLYVEKKDSLSRVPEALLQRFGKPELAMTLMLDESTRLATTTPQKVMEAIQEQGYYLQMPPIQNTEMAELAKKNTKLSV